MARVKKRNLSTIVNIGGYRKRRKGNKNSPTVVCKPSNLSSERTAGVSVRDKTAESSGVNSTSAAGSPQSVVSPCDPSVCSSIVNQPMEVDQSTVLRSTSSTSPDLSSPHGTVLSVGAAGDLNSPDQISSPKLVCTEVNVPSPSSVPNLENQSPTSSSKSDSLDMNSITKDILDKLQLFLPRFWLPHADTDGVYVFMLSRQKIKAVQRSIFFSFDGDVNLMVHCVPINVDPYVKDAAVFLPVTMDTVSAFVDRAIGIVNKVRLQEICSGIDSERYKEIWASCEYGEVDTNPYQECRYTETFRSWTCSRLVDYSTWRCSECSKLLKIVERKLTSTSEEIHHLPTKNVSEGEELKKLQDMHREALASKRLIERMHKRIENLIAAEGVQIDKEFADDLIEVLRSHVLTPAQEVFLQQQVKASQAKNICGMRWHPIMIRLALSVYLQSPSAYKTLMNTGVVRLPSSTTLLDYTRFQPVELGIDKVALESLALAVDKSPAYQRYFVLMVDEIHVSHNLVHQKSSGDLIGFTHLDHLNNEIQFLEDYLDNTCKRYPQGTKQVLTYMVKGVSSNVREVIASYLVCNLSPCQMYLWTWKVICALEICGIAVIAFICDGSPTHRAFIKRHRPATDAEKVEVMFEILNRAAPSRKLYFICDAPHLLKSVRNCFAKSRLGKEGKLLLQRKNENIVWDFIIKLYNIKKRKTFKVSYMLKSQNVFLDSHACRKVAYAAEVLSRTVARDIEIQKWVGSSETVRFIRLMSDWFECLIGGHSTHGRKIKNPRLKPYTNINDERFIFLQSVLQYFEDWKCEAYNRQPQDQSNESFSTVHKENLAAIDCDSPVEGLQAGQSTPPAKKMLSHQTLSGIQMTVQSFIAVTKFLLNEGTPYVDASVFCLDPLEKFFNKQQGAGANSSIPNLE